ncbi:MAG: hypothetical protein HY744_07635 [Deltaproteobacteria bacterium]|nr:hypothetical protein [Deltaproteobacteria bacterium]
MRILDEGSDKALNMVTLFLLRSEAVELRDRLSALLQREYSAGNHEHTSSADYQKEITVCIYNEGDLRGFDDRLRRLVRNDE